MSPWVSHCPTIQSAHVGMRDTVTGVITAPLGASFGASWGRKLEWDTKRQHSDGGCTSLTASLTTRPNTCLCSSVATYVSHHYAKCLTFLI